MDRLKSAADAILERAVTSERGVPGVVAMATDKNANIYEGAAGKRALGYPADMTLDTVFSIFALTKAITGTALLQLVEEGKVDLDAPAKTYVPEIRRLQVLDGFSALGNPKLRPPKRDITPRMLMLHTAGLGYEVFNREYHKLTMKHGQTSTATSTKASLMSPLLFDPGERWEYGSGIDWCGLIVERQRGMRLGEVMQERIFAPLGMTSTGFKLTASMRERFARIHQRGAGGELSPQMDMEWPKLPEIQMGGHALYGTAGDYCRFIRMWLNDGAGENGRVLNGETVRMAEKNGLGDKKINPLRGTVPSVSSDVDFFPGLAKSWGLSFMIVDEDAPTGRPAGSLSWAGLANLFYWIDPKNGIGGIWATQVLPFMDEVSYGGYLDFEAAVYSSMTEHKH
jgi:methyl acetate hydrolase